MTCRMDLRLDPSVAALGNTELIPRRFRVVIRQRRGLPVTRTAKDTKILNRIPFILCLLESSLYSLTNVRLQQDSVQHRNAPLQWAVISRTSTNQSEVTWKRTNHQTPNSQTGLNNFCCHWMKSLQCPLHCFRKKLIRQLVRHSEREQVRIQPL